MYNFVRIYGAREKNTRRNLNNSGQERKRQASSHLMPCPQARHIKTNKRESGKDDMKNNIVSKYLKMFGLSRLKQVVYIMRTSEDQYPRNKYLNWDDYIKTKNGYDNYFYICSNTIEELEYQINQQASEQKG